MANSFNSSLVLGLYDSCTVREAYDYGKLVGIAYQLVDNVLDFDADGDYGGGNNNNGSGDARKKTGKSTLTDMISAVVMAPVLYAAQLYPDQLNLLVENKFKGKGDVDIVMKYLRESDGVLRKRDQARVHADLEVRAAFKLVLMGGWGVGGEGGVDD